MLFLGHMLRPEPTTRAGECRALIGAAPRAGGQSAAPEAGEQRVGGSPEESGVTTRQMIPCWAAKHGHLPQGSFEPGSGRTPGSPASVLPDSAQGSAGTPAPTPFLPGPWKTPDCGPGLGICFRSQGGILQHTPCELGPWGAPADYRCTYIT